MIRKHGFAGHLMPEYTAWLHMKARCTRQSHPNFKNYGGRGISVCQKWVESFPAFLADVGYRPTDLHSLDRINNDGHYEPANVRWATRRQQLLNKRTNFRIQFNGETKTITEWAEITQISRLTLTARLKQYHWPIERALTEAVYRFKPAGQAEGDAS